MNSRQGIDCHAITSKIFGIIISLDVFNRPKYYSFLKSNKKHCKVGIITNGSTQRQKAKIFNTNLNKYFETIIISEEVGFSKPDKRIFELALNKLNLQPENTLFVGDDLEKDIAGPQNANIKGVWFNPQKIKNTTKIQPYAEINTLDSLLSYVTPQYFYNK